MQTATLPQSLTYRNCTDLVRLGGQADGGYLISENDIAQADFLLSLGINTDWAFEDHFTTRNPVPVRAFDPTTNLRLFLKQAVGELAQGRLRDALRTPFRYREMTRFFSGNRSLGHKYVGLSAGGMHASLADTLGGVTAQSIYIKMDIEGSEYRCLPDLIALQDRICGMAIEFHDVDLHMDRITAFVQEIGIPIAHIHANNYAPVTPEGVPLVIEVTFSRHGAFTDDAPALPHPLDSPNLAGPGEIRITFGQGL